MFENLDKKMSGPTCQSQAPLKRHPVAGLTRAHQLLSHTPVARAPLLPLPCHLAAYPMRLILWSGSVVGSEPDTGVELMVHMALTSLCEDHLAATATLPVALLPI
jgi:hypothetical protein